MSFVPGLTTNQLWVWFTYGCGQVKFITNELPLCLNLDPTISRVHQLVVVDVEVLVVLVDVVVVLVEVLVVVDVEVLVVVDVDDVLVVNCATGGGT